MESSHARRIRLSYRQWHLGLSSSSSWVVSTLLQPNGFIKLNLKCLLTGSGWRLGWWLGGFEQQFSIDFNATFATVLKWSTLRTIIAMAVALGWSIEHMDIVTAPRPASTLGLRGAWIPSAAGARFQWAPGQTSYDILDSLPVLSLCAKNIRASPKAPQ